MNDWARVRMRKIALRGLFEAAPVRGHVPTPSHAGLSARPGHLVPEKRVNPVASGRTTPDSSGDQGSVG